MKYYTAFIYKELDPDSVHCTHKYLGTQTSQELYSIDTTINLFMGSNSRRVSTIIFNKEEIFGSTRVLTPENIHLARVKLFPELRLLLDTYRVDDYPDYNPHVTSPNLKYIGLPFYSYALIDNTGNVIREWVLE